MTRSIHTGVRCMVVAVLVASAFLGCDRDPGREAGGSASGGAAHSAVRGAELTREALEQLVVAERAEPVLPDAELPGLDSVLPIETERGGQDRTPRSIGDDAWETSMELDVGSLHAQTAKIGWRAQLNAGGGFPADPQLAVSTTHVVVTARQRMGFYTKSGQQLATMSSATFFSSLDDGTVDGFNRFNDLRTVYDPFRRRFWVAAIGSNQRQSDTDQRRYIAAVAVSKSEDPLDGWYFYWWDAVGQYGQQNSSVWEPGTAADYPIIAVDAFGIHQTNAVVHKDAGIRYWHVVFFPGAPLAAGASGINGWQFWDLKNPDGGDAGLMQPVQHHGWPGRTFYVSRYANSILVWSLTNWLTAQQSMTRVEVEMPSAWSSPENAPQLGSDHVIKMTNLGTNPLKAVYRRGFVHIVTNDARDWFGDGQMLSSVRLIRIPVDDYPEIPTGAGHGFINRVFGKNNKYSDAPEDRIYYAWPAIEVNRWGDMVLVYSRSGATIHPEARYSIYDFGDPDISPSHPLRAGDAPYQITYPSYQDDPIEVLPWGDIAGASVDPSDDEAIWVAHQFATDTVYNSNGNYDVYVARILSSHRPDWTLGRDWRAIQPFVHPEDPVTIVGTIHNYGDGISPPAIVVGRLIDSTGRAFSLGRAMLEAMPAGGSRTVRLEGLVPPALPPGAYRLEIDVNPGHSVQEHSFANNVTRLRDLEVRAR